MYNSIIITIHRRLTPLNLNRPVLLTDGILGYDVYPGTRYLNDWTPKTRATAWRFLKKKKKNYKNL